MEKHNNITSNKIVSKTSYEPNIQIYLEAAEDDVEQRNKIMNCKLSDDMIGLGKTPKKKPADQGQNKNGELDLTGIDDDEINEVFVDNNFCLKKKIFCL